MSVKTDVPRDVALQLKAITTSIQTVSVAKASGDLQTVRTSEHDLLDGIALSLR